MTVIAWHVDIGVAVDSQCTIGGAIVPAQKYLMHEGVLYVASGDASLSYQVFDAIIAGKPVACDMSGLTVREFTFAPEGPLTVRRVGKGYLRGGDVAPTSPGIYGGGGAGGYAAVAALAAGKTPVEACLLACEIEYSCGGHIHFFNTKGEKVC